MPEQTVRQASNGNYLVQSFALNSKGGYCSQHFLWHFFQLFLSNEGRHELALSRGFGGIYLPGEHTFLIKILDIETLQGRL